MLEEEHESADSALKETLNRIERTTKLLRNVGFELVLVTMANLFVFLGYMASARVETKILQFLSPDIYLLIQAAFSICAIFLAAAFEVNRRQADVLFEEVSDELHWQRNTVENMEKHRDSKPRLRARLVLREYARAAELAFVPGRMGPAISILFNLLVMIVAIALVTLFKLH